MTRLKYYASLVFVLVCAKLFAVATMTGMMLDIFLLFCACILVIAVAAYEEWKE